MLFRRLYNLGEEFLEAAMVSQNREALTEKVLVPFFNCGSDCEQLSNVCGGAEKLRAERFVEIRNRVAALRKNCTHSDAGGVRLHREWELKIW